MDTIDAVREITECRVCGTADWQDVVSFGPVPLANAFLDPAASYGDEPRFPLGVVSCRTCRLMSLTHVVDPELLYRDYAYTTPESETIDRHMRHVGDVCRRRLGLREDDLVVEIGSNTGAQLRVFGDTGMRTLGVDPARNVAEIAIQEGIETLPEFFSPETAAGIAATHGRAKLVLARHVIAHIDDLSGVAEALRALLRPDGVFVMEVPYAVDLLERVAFDTIYHEHLSYFSVGALAVLFERTGMKVLDVERFPVHGGSILVFVGPQDGPHPVRPAVGELLALEERAGLRDEATYHRFTRNVDRIRDELPVLVRGVVAAGERVAGYGAPAKGNTILNVCGLGPEEIAFCTDTTGFKQGKVLPGTHVPVVAPEHARTDVPGCYLLLAWNYADEIIRKESAFLDNGGRFIVPIPRPSMVTASSRGTAATR